MKKYELMFIVKPVLEEAAVKKIADDMQKVIEKEKGKVVELKNMGKRELAYEMKKFKTGHYFLLTIEAPVNAIEEFTRIANVSEDIIRYLVVKLED